MFVRIVQGLAFGAEWGGAILMSYEHAPWKSKGKYTGIVQAGFPVGLLLANLVFLVSVNLGGELAWRIPFLASIVLVVVGLIIRSKVPESPVFDEVKDSGAIVKSPITEVIKTDWRNIVKGIGLRIAETAGYAVSITYMISYLHTEQLADKTQTLVALCIASAIGIFATQAWARLTDRIGRRPLYIWSCAFALLFGIPMFLLVNTGLFIAIIATLAISYAVCQNSLAGAQGAWFPELFQAKTRSSGASLAYQISAMVSGFTPFVTTLLFVSFGWMGPALLFSTYAAIGLWAAVATRETWGKRERQLADEATKSTPRVGERLMASNAGTHMTAAARLPANRPTERDSPRQRRRVPDPAPRAEHGRGPGPGLRRPGPRRGGHVRRRLRGPAPVPRRRSRRGRNVTGSCSPPATTPSATTRPSPRPESSRSRNWTPTAPTIPGCRCPGCPPTPPAWKSPAAPSATASPSPSASPWACATRVPRRRVYNFLSDGELDEGSTWEAAMGAHHHQLGNLTAMVDINALQADGKTDTVLRTEPVTEKWEAFGWYTQRVDGNDISALLTAFDNAAAQAAAVGRPSVILCDTKVGRGVPLLEDREKAHFMRIEEHEWQTCREQLTAGYEEKASR